MNTSPGGAPGGALQPLERVVGFRATCTGAFAGSSGAATSDPYTTPREVASQAPPPKSQSFDTPRSPVSLLRGLELSDRGSKSAPTPVFKLPEVLPTREQETPTTATAANPATSWAEGCEERSRRSTSLAIQIPERVENKPLIRPLSGDQKPRMLRRVPEPPIAPSAITAPAVVQLLLASQASAAAEQLRVEQNAFCRRNNLKQAYDCHEKLVKLQAQARQLEAEVGSDWVWVPRQTNQKAFASNQPRRPRSSAPARRSVLDDVCTDGSKRQSLDWADWYQIPHGNIAAADYCSGLDDSLFDSEQKHSSGAYQLSPRCQRLAS